MIRSALMTVMTSAAIKAGRGLKRDFGEIGQLQVSMKGPGDFVSLADKRAEKMLYEELAKARPGYGFVMEESGRPREPTRAISGTSIRSTRRPISCTRFRFSPSRSRSSARGRSSLA